MTLDIFGLISSYAYILILLLLILIYARLGWIVKACCMIAGLAFFVVHYYSYSPLMGWPTKDTLPDHVQVISGFVKQPNKITGYPGGIFIWAVDMNKNIGRELPRSYRLPYSDPLHQRVVDVRRKTMNGVPQMAMVVSEPDEKERLASQASNAGSGGAIAPIHFYDMPVHELPTK